MFGLSGASEGTLRYKGPLASEMSVASSELGSVPSHWGLIPAEGQEFILVSSLAVQLF